MLNTETNYQTIQFSEVYQVLILEETYSKKIDFPWWDTSEVSVSLILDKTSHDMKLFISLSTYEESKKMGKFMFYVNEMPSVVEEEQWTQEQINRAYIYIRRKSQALQEYDPYNYETPSPQEIAKNMDNIVGIIQDKILDVSEEVQRAENLITINLTRDSIRLVKDETGAISLTDAYSEWSISNQSGEEVTSKFTCSLAKESTYFNLEIRNNESTDPKFRVTIKSLKSSSIETGSKELIKLQFVSNDQSISVVFYKYIQVTIDELAEDGKAYILDIDSSNGNIFKPGEGMETILTAHIFLNGNELTDIGAYFFTWTRYSYDQEKMADLDKIFNDNHKRLSGGDGGNKITVTPTDVYHRATYSCFCEFS